MKTKLTWLAGCLCLAVALSIAPGVSGDGSSRKSPMALNGRVTKPYPRENDPRMEKRIKSPRQEFEAARKRGLTEEEVRGIVEEYIAAVAFEDEPHRPLEEILNKLRKERLDMYLEALADGFNLSEEQIAVIESKLPSIAAHQVAWRILLESVDRAWELSVPGTSGVIAEPKPITRREQIETIAGHPITFTDEGMHPWQLFGLSESQKQMIGYQDDSGEWIWVDGRETTFDFGTTECYGDLDDPFAAGVSVMGAAGVVFPLSMLQVERLGDFEDQAVSPHTPKTKSGGDLDRVKFLTRPQLKTLLLFNPAMAGELMKEFGE